MKKKTRVLIYLVAVIMAVTCFVPVTSVTYAATGETDQQSNTAEGYTGWKTVNGKNTYYMNGKRYTGTYTSPKTGLNYYFENGRPFNGLREVKSDNYRKHFYVGGRYFNGWRRVKSDGNRPHYYKDGCYHTGWVYSDGKRKYYTRNGVPLKGIKKIRVVDKSNNRASYVYYEFNDKTGVYKRKVGDRMDMKAQNYKSKKKYLVLVSYKKHQVRIYKGKKNKWKRVKKFKCSMGRNHCTPTGTFKITGRGRYFDTGTNIRCWYWTGFIGSVYLFHSTLYDRSSSPSHSIDSRLGRNISHGCIRLKLKNARWIYNNVPRGSKVVIKDRF